MRLNQNDKSLNPGYYIDPRAGAINGAAEIAPASVNLDIGSLTYQLRPIRPPRRRRRLSISDRGKPSAGSQPGALPLQRRLLMQIGARFQNCCRNVATETCGQRTPLKFKITVWVYCNCKNLDTPGNGSRNFNASSWWL
jgi:hypothetical protein